jgi:hypothetical protein
MNSLSLPRTRRLTIIAQDPSVKDRNGNILKTAIEIPAEDLAPGPLGFRVNVIDYDTSTGKHYIPIDYEPPSDGKYDDPFEEAARKGDDNALMTEPRFHCQNVYAIIVRTLARFEAALGRRIGWGFSGHQIHVAPHAFADANAFYSENDRALLFGYFRPENSVKNRQNGNVVFTCLSHDVVAHETTHALLDGLYERYTDPSSPDQAGFHEGFADVVALLSVFSLKDVVAVLLDQLGAKTDSPAATKNLANDSLIDADILTIENLRSSVLFGLADQMGQELSGIRGGALRRSALLKPLKSDDKQIPYAERDEFKEPHRRGELLVAAMLNTFLYVWLKRLQPLLQDRPKEARVDKLLVIEEGADAAAHLLTMAIRALDYMPPTDLHFSDYLSALLTADSEIVPDDTKYNYRGGLRENFLAYGIKPCARTEEGVWECVDVELCYDRTRFESLRRDSNEVFRFLWDNRAKLGVDEKAYTEVQSVRPSSRVGPDGFILRETVASYTQTVTLKAKELETFNINLPEEMPLEMEITLYGGGNLIFDEYGKLKYHIRNRIFNQRRQTSRLKYLWDYGYFTDSNKSESAFAQMHLDRTFGFRRTANEAF